VREVTSDPSAFNRSAFDPPVVEPAESTSGFAGGSFLGGEVTAQMSARRKARKRALDVLYQADLRSDPRPKTLAAYVAQLEEPRPQYLPYTVRLVEGVEQHAERIDELLSSYAEGWTLERMPVIDRNLARIAVYELLYNDEIDSAVAITEAVELAETLSTDDSPRFLNGILGRIADYAT
jgi:N utilization substance protein B